MYFHILPQQLKLTKMKQQSNQNRFPNRLQTFCCMPKKPGLMNAMLCLLLSIGVLSSNAQVYTTSLSGAAEAPPNLSPGTGTVVVTINVPMATMRVQANFSGLQGNSTNAHIHAPTAVAGTGVAGVATTTPTFTGFPSGVTSGNYDNTFNMTLASSYNAAFITANGGTPASAFIALKAAIDAGKAYFNLHSSSFAGGEIRGFLACAQVMYAYNGTNKRLVSFLPSAPGTLLTNVALTGLATDEALIGFDYRPADGQFYGITSKQSSNMGRVVSINRTTGAVASVGTGMVAVPFDSTYALDFNPVPDRIRLISSSGRSRRYNPNDGTLAGTDVPLAFVAGDPNNGDPVVVAQAAYTKSIAGTPNTTLFAIDHSQNLLVRVGGTNGAPSPNGGATSTIGSLGVTTTSGSGGFDMNPSGMAYAILHVGGVSAFYTIDTATGAAMFVGNMAAAAGVVDGLSIVPCTPPVCVTPATRIYVDASVAVSGSGSSWGCAMKELSAAIMTANTTPSITSIWVADGTYKPTTTTNRSAILTLTRANLRILGGFAGGEANESDANPAANPTIISGDIGVANDVSDNSKNLLDIHDLAASANPLIIDGFTIREGNGGNVGAAVVAYSNNVSTVVRFRRCAFLNNTALGDGGAFYNVVAPMTFDLCRFAGNTAGGVGGAMYSYQSDFTFNDCVFANNTGTQGGAVYGNFGIPKFNRTVFTRNSATSGGAVYQNNMNTDYNNCVFNANTSSQDGGALFVHNSSIANIKNSTFFKNTAASGGGAVVLSQANSSINAGNTIFYKNTANGADNGAGSDITNLTGGANVYANNILQLNTAVPADNGGAIRNNIRGVDPLFVNEASPIGADNIWGTPDDGLGLMNASPAKASGDNALAPMGPDITNRPRIVGAIVDRGAYENQDLCNPVINRLYVDASIAVSGAGGNWDCAIKELSDAISMANMNPAITSIWVADGTYKPTTGTSRTALIAISRSNLTILGGFASGETLASQANPAANPTIISGDIGVPNDASDNSKNLLDIHDLAASANPLVIDGFTIRDGNGGNVGAAVVAYSNNLSTVVSFRRCAFLNNTALGDGGAFYNVVAPMTFDSCRFAGNTAGGVGGAMFSYQSNFTFNDCVFANNAGTQGGAVYGNLGVPTFNRTVFTSNSAIRGGALYQNNMNTDYNNCVFNANTASQDGGAIYVHNFCAANISNSTFFKNTAASNGGALVLSFGANTNTHNSIFWKNAVNGSTAAPTAVLINYTTGANVFANNALQANTTIPVDNGTNIRNNTRGVDPLFTNEASPIGADGIWATSDDGLQLTTCVNTSFANINGALPTCSPAINTGDNALAPAGGDIRNNSRIVCNIVDKGAYENQNCGTVVTAAEPAFAGFSKQNSASDITGIVANPFTSDLQIRYMGTEKAAVTVYALSGKTMWSKNNISQGVTHADAGAWSRGMYQVVITTASGKRINFKVIKM